jgi:hypothetical protein
MRKITILMCAAALFILSGCIPATSVHPFCSEKDAVFDKAIVGTWVRTYDNKEYKYEITEIENKGYWIKYTEGTSSVRFNAIMFKVGEKKYMDLRLDPGSDWFGCLNTGFVTHLLLVHSLARIEIKVDSIKVSFLRWPWVKEKLEKNEINLAHEDEAGGYVITASTDELRKFIQNSCDLPEVFGVDKEIEFEIKKQK